MRALVEDMTGDHPARPCAVVSNKETAGGIRWAEEQGIATVVVDHKPYGTNRAAFEAALTTALAPHNPDIICLAGFMRKLTGGFTDAWRGRMINIHPSLLPKYKGLRTHARALEAGDAEHGCSVHEVTAELDDGPVLGQAKLDVADNDTAESLAARVLKLEHQLYPAVLRRFAAGDRSPIFLPR